MKTTLTRAKAMSKQALDLEIIWHFGKHGKFGLKMMRLEIDWHPKLKDKISKQKKNLKKSHQEWAYTEKQNKTIGQTAFPVWKSASFINAQNINLSFGRST